MGESLESGQHLLKLIDNILDITNIESGLAELDLGEFAIADVLKNSLLLLQRQASNRGSVSAIRLIAVRVTQPISINLTM